MYDIVLTWVRLHRKWHAETEEGMTLCTIITKARAERVAYRPTSDLCDDCDRICRRLRDMREES